MDLGQIKRKLDKGEYPTIHDAAEDVRLVWKNCMQYNADGSDFYKLAQKLSKTFEDKYAKVLKELNVLSPEKKSGDGASNGGESAAVSAPAPEPTLEEKRAFAKNLYSISKEELGKVIVDLDNSCPKSILRNSAEDQLEINVDEIDPEAFQKAVSYVTKCIADSNGRKKKSANGGGNKSKKNKSS